MEIDNSLINENIFYYNADSSNSISLIGTTTAVTYDLDELNNRLNFIEKFLSKTNKRKRIRVKILL